MTQSTDSDTKKDSEFQENLQPDVRVGFAIYLHAMNTGIVTSQGVLLPNAMNMTQIATLAEVSVNFAIKALSELRKQGFVKNRHEDGRLLLKLPELEAWLESNGAAI